MPHAKATADVPVDVDTLWRQIGSFQGVGDWHPMLTKVEGDGEAPGATRTATAADGSQQVEWLQDADPAEHRYSYVMESTPLPVRDYTGRFSANAAGDDATTVRWSADFEVTSKDEARAVDMVQGFLDAGLDNLRQQYQ